MREIKQNHWYTVQLAIVKDKYRRNFNRHGIQFVFKIPELNDESIRTLNVPNHFRPVKNVFIDFISPILPEVKSYPVELLNNPFELGKRLHKDLAGKQYKAWLAPSRNGQLIDVIKVKALMGS